MSAMALAAVDAGLVQEWRAALTDAPLAEDVVRMIDEVRALEELKAAAEARQARLTAVFDARVRADAAAQGVPQQLQGRGIAEQIGFARRVSSHRAHRLVALACVLARELPHTQRAFDLGVITEHRASVIVRETATLSLEHRRLVDEAISQDPAAVSLLGTKALAARTRARAAQLDAASVARARGRAESERRVTIRPAPDTMVYLTALLPVRDGVAAYAALRRTAEAAVRAGRETSLGRVMSDTLVHRLLAGDKPAEGRTPVPVTLNLTMSAEGLLDPDSTARHVVAHLDGYGPVPAGLAREMVADAMDAGLKTWVRRLFTRPDSSALVAIDSKARLFPKGIARFIQLRDRFCRNPWCDAPIRHRDHVEGWGDGGETTAENGQGLCEACNHAKQAMGWSAHAEIALDGTHVVVTTTPTGHTYRSHAPPTDSAA